MAIPKGFEQYDKRHEAAKYIEERLMSLEPVSIAGEDARVPGRK